ncbi:aspartate aminotransferase family protein, partial [Candidatus Wirthbacteria bacterium CG2_30_54_11]
MPDTGTVFPRNFKSEYPVIVRGEGVYLYDEQGNRYLDSCAGAAVANIGHGNAEVAEVLGRQASQIAYLHSSRFTSQPALDLATKVAKWTPGDLKYTYFVSGGSEAVETALKMARQYFVERDGRTSKYKIISRWVSFHGNTLGALSVTGKPGLRKIYDPMLIPFPHTHSVHCARCESGMKRESCSLECAQALETTIKREGSENIAAFIAEPVVGSAAPGACPREEYYRVVREICDRYDILFIADEVMNGFGRTGRNFGIDHFAVVPDLMTIAKGISSGYTPLGGVVASERVAEVFKKGSGRFSHGFTYVGNPLSCAVGCKVLEIMERDHLVDNSRLMGELLLKRLREELASHPLIGDIRGLGLQLGVDFVKDKKTGEPYPAAAGIGGLIGKAGLKNGINFYPGGGNYDGALGDNILLTPP